jgi:hypothetical protein
MPAQQNETLNVVEVELALDIFNEEFIIFKSDSSEIISKIDRTQLIRIITTSQKRYSVHSRTKQEDKRFSCKKRSK